jgi:hypothetical protein
VVSLLIQVTLEPVTTVKVTGENPELVIEMVPPGTYQIKKSRI